MNKGKARIQYAALPYRRRADAILEVMLITSRDSGRWVIPKGWQGTGLAGQELGGARGARGRRAGGADRRRARSGSIAISRSFPTDRRCLSVEVFTLEASGSSSHGRSAERDTRWFSWKGRAAVEEPALAAMIRNLRALAELQPDEAAAADSAASSAIRTSCRGTVFSNGCCHAAVLAAGLRPVAVPVPERRCASGSAG